MQQQSRLLGKPIWVTQTTCGAFRANVEVYVLLYHAQGHSLATNTTKLGLKHTRQCAVVVDNNDLISEAFQKRLSCNLLKHQQNCSKSYVTDDLKVIAVKIANLSIKMGQLRQLCPFDNTRVNDDNRRLIRVHFQLPHLTEYQACTHSPWILD